MGRPKPPDPMQVARQQQGFNQDAQRDAAQLGQPNQVTPWGNVGYSGEIGSPDRTQTVTLNPADQARLEQERSIKSRLLSMILGGGQGMGGGGQAQGKQGQAQPMPPMGMGQGQGPPPDPQQMQQMQQMMQQIQQQQPPPQQPMGMGPGGPTMEEMMAWQNGGQHPGNPMRYT